MPPVTLPQALALALEHYQAGRMAEAESIYRQILTVAPENSDALNFLGIVAGHTGRPELAVDLMRRSILLQPGIAAYHDNLGTILREMGRPEEATACSRRALELEGDSPITHSNLANALQDMGQLTEAMAGYERALALDPLSLSAWLGLARASGEAGLVRGAVDAYRQALQLDPHRADVHSSLVANLHYLADATPDEILAEHRHWNQIHAEPLRREWTPHRNNRDPNRRLRIGYVSPDFRDHPVAFFLENLLAAHDRATVEVFCYAGGRRCDAVTARLRAHAHHWREIAPLSDTHAAALVRQDQVDILVDLAGHTAGNRLLLFARRPAPVQVTYLGYAGTTGLAAMDYLLTDAHVDPPEAGTRDFPEQLVRVPGTCFRPFADAPAVAPLPAQHRGFVTFGSFHTLAKLSAPLLEWWAHILAGVPDSRLLLAATGLRDHGAQKRLQRFLAAHGVSEDRLTFRGWQSTPAYLAMHGEVDILLDSHPFSGHTVSCHALWMGVPVVTLAGIARCSRLVTSVLRNVDLPELVTDSPAEYIRIARALAIDLPRLAALRATLRERMAGSPLLEAPRLARAVEAAYRQMWRTWST